MSEMLTWPVGSRDTTEFPKITSSLSVEFRDHFTNIIAQDGKPWNDIGSFGTPSRFRSYRKMYERLGVIYKDGGKLSTTWLGKSIANIKEELQSLQSDMIAALRNKIVAVLSRYQFKNPSDKDSGSLPADFDIQPCVCFWKMMLALDNKISYEEVNRVVLRVMHMADIEAAIEKIKNARTILTTNRGANLDEILGPQVITDQPTARIAGLFSQIGWGNLLITGVEDDGCRHLVDAAIPTLKKVEADPPHFFQTSSEDEWLAYFIGTPDELQVDAATIATQFLSGPPMDNRLIVALKLFESLRGNERQYDDFAIKTRTMFDDVDGEKLKTIDWDSFCNEHFSGSQVSAHFRGYADEEKEQLGAWLKCSREEAKDISSELMRMPQLKGLGTGGTTPCMFLMKANPEYFCSYADQGYKAFSILGLSSNDKAPSFSFENYYHNKELQTRIRGEMTRLKIGREDGRSADYLTVNTFLWWVTENGDLIKEKVMAKKYKPTEIEKVAQKKFSETEVKDFKGFIDKLEKDVAEAGLKYAHGLMKRFVCAQLAKPFVVLTGLSGSGKTKLAEAFTKWIGVANTVNIVPVGADWTNNEKLLGYPNALDPDNYVMPDTGVLKLMLDANENQDLPFFLILDEMNLSHVERYFADFLSTMESHDGIIELYDSGKRYAEDGREIPPSFRFPKNLFVIGTMNVDETTYMFSPKVLDRAQVIEFRVSEKDMTDFLTAPGNPKVDDLAGRGAAYAKAFLDLAKERKAKQPTGGELTKVKDALAAVFPPLAELGAEFGYRSAIEILTFVAYYLEASGYSQIADNAEKAKCLVNAIDAGMLQKLLPKLHGSLNRLGPVIDTLIGKVSTSKPLTEGSEANPEIEKTYPLTYEKLQRMKLRVEKNGFTSFAEA